MISLVRTSIAAAQVDAIVNAANEAFRGGGGVDGAIHREAGPELLEECKTYPRLPTGSAVLTKGYRLPARWIIHTVGPIWQGGTQGEAATLASCYARSLAVADELGARTVAFPAIATGVYGYPAQAAADLAVASVRNCATEVTLIRFVAFDETTLAYYQQLI
jgi:O-acetyl-ADP-ribose deacetylase (regulator of RNase III)